MKKLQDALGYGFKNEALLRLALTHPSCGAENNQRLEFLGDAVLELYISEILYRRYSDFDEGTLTSRRAALVCERTLALLARALDLGGYLILNPGEERTGGREKPSVLADAVEALLAAVYLDGGQEAARAVVARLFQNENELLSWQSEDHKGELQSYTQARGLPMPEYAVISESGPDHSKSFTVSVSVSGRELGRGTGGSKKAAEKAAARAALRELNSSASGGL